VLAVQQEIARVRGEIEQMEGEQKNLEHRVDFATVGLNLSEEYKTQLGTPAPSISSRFHNALVRGIRDAREIIVGIVLATLAAQLRVCFFRLTLEHKICCPHRRLPTCHNLVTPTSPPKEWMRAKKSCGIL
jgi:Domain of unknown function (DUF4349)